MSGKLLTVQEAAELLRLHPRTVMNMAKRGDLPGSKIGKQWRFDATALENWLTLRMGNPEPTRLAPDASVSLPDMVSELFWPESVRSLERLESRTEVLEELALLLERHEGLPDYRVLLELLEEREQMVSTALGNGVAFPHPRHPLTSLSEPILAALVVREGVDFGSPEGELTHFFIAILSHNDVAHVRILAKLVHLFRETADLRDLRQSTTPEDVLEEIRRLEIKARARNGNTLK